MRLGIIGGGQLARMMVPPAHRLGIEVWTLEKTDDCPAKLVGAKQVVGDWSDPEVTLKFCKEVDVVTLDHEFTPLAVLERIGERLRPGYQTMLKIADKFEQKLHLQKAGLRVVESRAFQTEQELREIAEEFGRPLMVKARRGGYDGKGNLLLRDLDEMDAVFQELSGPLYAERYLPFEREVAVMVARGLDGRSLSYPVVDTVQENHICRCVRYPATLSRELEQRAREVGRACAEAVGVVGVLGVEMFVDKEGEIVVNELAPRPHNSGHYTLDASLTSQFENHVRAVCELPLGSVDSTVEQAVMVNLLGDGHGSGYPRGLSEVLKEPGAKMHLYGKASKPGRKLGHLTLVGSRAHDLETRALELAGKLTFKES